MTESMRLIPTEEYQRLKKVEKQLEIATKTLEHMAKFPTYYHDYTGDAAKKALKEIEGVK